MLSQQEMRTLKQIAAGIARQFGANCEVVIHVLGESSAYSSTSSWSSSAGGSATRRTTAPI